MEKEEKYCYPAIFTYEPDKKIAVVSPDLDVATSGTDDLDALRSARELLRCVILGIEEDEKYFPAPTPLNELTLNKNERTVLIDV